MDKLKVVKFSGNAGGGGGMDNEKRMTRLETTAEHMQGDIADLKTDMRDFRREVRTEFRFSYGVMVTGFTALAGLMAKGFGWW